MRDAIKRRPQLRALAANPLMLTVMVTVARHRRLGRSRTEIYRQALDLLCYGWDYRRGIKLPTNSPLADLDPTDTLNPHFPDEMPIWWRLGRICVDVSER